MIFIVAFAGLGFLANTATARIVQISGTHSKGEILKKCADVGGIPQGSASGGYSCFNGNKGTSVDCSSQGHCVGWVPGRFAPGAGVADVLSGGELLQ